MDLTDIVGWEELVRKKTKNLNALLASDKEYLSAVYAYLQDGTRISRSVDRVSEENNSVVLYRSNNEICRVSAKEGVYTVRAANGEEQSSRSTGQTIDWMADLAVRVYINEN